ncbi:MAG: sensor histidine kinase [bacterium]
MKEEKKFNFFWAYATASIFLLIILVGFHSLWQMEKGKEALYKGLYDQGEALVESLQSSGKNAIISNRLVQEMLIARLLDNAKLIDILIGQNNYNSILLKDIAVKNNLFRVQVVDQWGRIRLDTIEPSFPDILSRLPFPQESFGTGIKPILQGEKHIIIEGAYQDQPLLGNLFWIAMARKNFQGAIIIHVDAYYMEGFRKEIGIGKLINDISTQKGIRYIAFQGRNNLSISPEDISLPELHNVRYEADFVEAGFNKLVSGEEVYEIVKPFIFQDNVLGFFRVALSLDEFTRNIRRSQKHTIWFSLLIIGLGSIGLIFIFYHQYIQYKRQKMLEENLHRTERLNSVGKLAAGVAHEIRNPLNAIGMTIQRFQHEYLPEQEENKQEFIHLTNVIREEVKRVDKIIGNFLDFAREPKLELHYTNIISIIEDILAIFAVEAEKQHIIIQTEYEHSPLMCLCDPRKMKQALINIIKNAIQAMPDGGTLSVNVGQRRDILFISVRDEGIGIADTSKIFEFYYTSKEGGVGIGLPICQKIIQEHGGKIEVQSEIGKGTAFHIALPLKITERSREIQKA